MPNSCHPVVEHVRTTEEHFPLEEVFEKSRRLLFMTKKIDEYLQAHEAIDVGLPNLIDNTEIL